MATSQMCNFPSGKGYIRPTVSPQAAAGKSQVLQLEWAMGPSAAARTGMGGAATRTGMGGAATRTVMGGAATRTGMGGRCY